MARFEITCEDIANLLGDIEIVDDYAIEHDGILVYVEGARAFIHLDEKLGYIALLSWFGFPKDSPDEVLLKLTNYLNVSGTSSFSKYFYKA